MQLQQPPACLKFGLPDEMRVHELCSDWSQDLIVAVLNQAELAGIEDHTHLSQRYQTSLVDQQSQFTEHVQTRPSGVTHIFIFKEELLVAARAGPRYLAQRAEEESELLLKILSK